MKGSSLQPAQLGMISAIRDQWKEKLLAARRKSQEPSSLRAFDDFGHDRAVRASYFTAISAVVHDLGLSNPHENSALSIEPPHPVLPSHLASSLDQLGLLPHLSSTYRDAKLSLLSLAMMERYSPTSDAWHMRRGSLRDPLYLLDPLYGFAFFRDGDRIRNHCFAIDVWQRHLHSMPPQLASAMWTNRADNMLSGGAFAGRFLFKNLVPEETDPLKRSTPPELLVHSEDQLLTLMTELKAQVPERSGIELWFRGQRVDYKTPNRMGLTREGIVPYSNLQESDFTPSLYRTSDKFLDNEDTYETLILELADWAHCARNLAQDAQIERSKQRAGPAAVTTAGLSSYQRGLILQQYGAPSAYLDITSDISIASWFATRECRLDNNHKMIVREYSSNHADPEQWPTIFVFPLVKGLHPYLDLTSMLAGSAALRPERQKCGLLGGAGNLARNYCARYVGLKIRLGPSFTLSNPMEEHYLFPPESEDHALSFLKERGLSDPKRTFALSELA